MRYTMLILSLALLAGCTSPTISNRASDARNGEALLEKYTSVRLTADVSGLTDNQRRMIPLLVDAAREMDRIFWIQAYGNRDTLLSDIRDPALRRFAEINYGPWDRLDDNAPFVAGAGNRPSGANFYPIDMTRAEFETAAAQNPALSSEYTMVRRAADGALIAIPYHEFFEPHVRRAAASLRAAAALAEDPGFRRYLELRADALLTDEYRESDRAWMDMKDNDIDLVIGPIEHYEDALFGYKAANEAFLLLKDRDWSARLSRYAALLPSLQRGLPVAEEYKREVPGADSDLNAYDVLYVAGDANAGGKTIAINLPNDELVRQEKGTRRLQLKNAMRAKYDEILAPIADVLTSPHQRTHIGFDAFFSNVMFHEVAHGLGIARVLGRDETVREALRERHAPMEEAKADILGLHMIGALVKAGELDADLRDHYVTFLAGIFRSVRFGAARAHGVANMIQFNFLREHEAFVRDPESGTYAVDFDKMPVAVDLLAERILRLQGDGEYAAVQEFVNTYGEIGERLAADLNRLRSASIPIDIVFEQDFENFR